MCLKMTLVNWLGWLVVVGNVAEQVSILRKAMEDLGVVAPLDEGCKLVQAP